MPLEQSPQLANPKSRLERFVLSQLCFQLLSCNLCGLRRSRQRTCYDYIRLHLQTVEKFRHLPHLFLTKIGERPFIIRLGPARPIGFTVSEKIELHIGAVKKLNSYKIKSERFGIRFNVTFQPLNILT